jgi:hypothetical protein
VRKGKISIREKISLKRYTVYFIENNAGGRMNLVGIKFNKIDAYRSESMDMRGSDVRIKLTKLEQKREDTALIHFVYRLDFKENVGYLALHGYSILNGTKSEMSAAALKWKKTKRLPEDVEKPLVSMISATSTTASVFAGHTLGFVPPFAPVTARV